MKFYVDGAECSDTTGAGSIWEDVSGGVFNCGLFGTSFEVRCTTACEPKLSLAQIFLWKERAVSIEGETYPEISTDGYACDSSSWPLNANSLLFNAGSCWYEMDTNLGACYCALSSTLYLERRRIAFGFDQEKIVTKVVALSRERSGNQFGIIISPDEITTSLNDYIAYSILTAEDGSQVNVVDYQPILEVDGEWQGYDILTWTSTGGHHMAKLVALGYDCLELHQTWQAPATLNFNSFGQIESLSAPNYDICTLIVNNSDLIFSFNELEGQKTGVSLDSWITIDADTNEITVTPSINEFIAYDG